MVSTIIEQTPISDPADYFSPEEYAVRRYLGLRPVYFRGEQDHPDQTCPVWCELHGDDPDSHGVHARRPMEARHASDYLEVLASLYKGERHVRSGNTTPATWQVRLTQTGVVERPAISVDLRAWDLDLERLTRTSRARLTLEDARELAAVLTYLADQAESGASARPL